MIVYFLGTASGLPHPDKKHSAILIKDNYHTFLIDCGEGVSQTFVKERINIEDLDLIFITHTHPDHLSGIYMLLQFFHMQARQKELEIYLPESIDLFISSLNFMYLFLDTLSFPIKFLSCSQINEKYKNLSTFSTEHLTKNADFVINKKLENKLFSFGISLHTNSKTLTYTSDISTINEVMGSLLKTDILIVDSIHPKVEDILELAKIIKDKIYLTHGCTQELFDIVKENEKFVIVDDMHRFIF